MMLDAVDAVRRLAPEALSGERLSAACVRTTNPKYLVFGSNPARPDCVVEFGDADRLRRLRAILSELHARMPAEVPRSLCCAPWRERVFVHIQSGLDGTPWFRVADSLATDGSWRSLLQRAAATMTRLHDASRAVAHWSGSVDIGAALADEVRIHRTSGTGVDRHVLQEASAIAARTRGCSVPAVWQHGDFSLNNLLVTPNQLSIIDFDEFGRTMMPLHDAFGLAFSFQLSQGQTCPLTVEECLDACTRAEAALGGFDETAVRALLFHHLLWRIQQCEGLPTRARLKAWLTSTLKRLVAWPASATAPAATRGEHEEQRDRGVEVQHGRPDPPCARTDLSGQRTGLQVAGRADRLRSA
jgi:aminoglycoside phosphotransferase (APT) family kinase protein